MADWRDNIRAQLQELHGDTHLAGRIMWRIDEQAVAQLAREFTTMPFPEETAHRYRTVEEVTAAQQEYAQAVIAYHEHADQASKDAERQWAAAIAPPRRATRSAAAGASHPNLTRRLSALDAV